jgi:hypothetical protein
MLEILLIISKYTNSDLLSDFKDLIPSNRVSPYPTEYEQYFREIYLGNSINTGMFVNTFSSEDMIFIKSSLLNHLPTFNSFDFNNCETWDYFVRFFFSKIFFNIF